MITRRSLTATLAMGTALSLGAAAFAVAGPAQATPPTPRPPRVLLGSHPRWADAGAARGTVPASTAVTAEVYLAPRGGEAALDTFVAAASTPGSAAYRHFLSASEYHARFGGEARGGRCLVLPQALSKAPVGVVRVDYVDSDAFDPAKGHLYTVRTFDQDSSLVTTKGWDDVTGVGTPQVPTLIAAIRAVAP